MSKFSMTFSADTLDELYASVASFVDRPVLVSAGPATVETVLLDASSPVSAPIAASADDEAGGTVNAGDFDAAGTPWDARIHASTKTTKADGTWTRRKNVSDVIYAATMAELSQRTAGTVPTAAPVVTAPASPVAAVGIVDNGQIAIPSPVVVPPPTMAAPTAVIPTVPVMPAATVPAMPETPAAPVVTPAVEAAVVVPATEGMPFQVFMPKVSAAMQSGKFNQETLNSWLAQWQLSSIMQFQADPVKAEQFYQWLKTAGMVD